MEIQHFDNSNQNGGYDLAIEQVGYESCEPSHSFGPAIRQHWLIHYVKRGKGVFQYAGKAIEITAGSMFLIYPNEVTFYQADDRYPWEYYWFGFSGRCSDAFVEEAGFSHEDRRVEYKLDASFSIDEIIKELTRKKIMNNSDKLFEISKLYEIFSWLFKNRGRGNSEDDAAGSQSRLLKAAEEYMKRSYMLDITIADAARHIGVDRTQLYRYFKHEYGTSPKQYLIDLRMNRAKRLVEGTRLPINQIACSVGYQDQYLFSKMFKKTYGFSPLYYRKKHIITGSDYPE